MIAPPTVGDPYQHPNQTSYPVGLGGVFTAWSWVTGFFGSAVPGFVNDMLFVLAY